MIKAIKGTKDILPQEVSAWHAIEKSVREVMNSFNYSEIRTPVFEETALFSRGIGESTDIVGKEMYTFNDRSGTSITLKPEMTAAVVRAFIEHSLGKIQPLNKLFYISPMFRQERPQAGRLRQFHQFGAEALGSASPLLDAEMIIIAYKILSGLGLSDLSVKINSLGVPESREQYKSLLREYLKPHFDKLTEDSRRRFETNILRIFDSKDERDIEIMSKAPVLLENLDDESLESFEHVKQALLNNHVPFEIDPKLVRGLDYYTHTTFEILSGSVGSQSALCGGGRYDLLIEQLGGTPAPGVGFAAGIERIILACQNENIPLDSDKSLSLYIVLLDKAKQAETYALAGKFRDLGIETDLDYSLRSVKAQLREANRLGAKFALFFGGEELAENKAQLKNMQNGDQQLISLADLESTVRLISAQ